MASRRPPYREGAPAATAAARAAATFAFSCAVCHGATGRDVAYLDVTAHLMRLVGWLGDDEALSEERLARPLGER